MEGLLHVCHLQDSEVPSKFSDQSVLPEFSWWQLRCWIQRHPRTKQPHISFFRGLLDVFKYTSWTSRISARQYVLHRAIFFPSPLPTSSDTPSCTWVTPIIHWSSNTMSSGVHKHGSILLLAARVRNLLFPKDSKFICYPQLLYLV